MRRCIARSSPTRPRSSSPAALACLEPSAATIRERTDPNPPDISQVMAGINGLARRVDRGRRIPIQDAEQGRPYRRHRSSRRSTSRRWRSASRSPNTRTPTWSCSRRRSAPSWRSMVRLNPPGPTTRQVRGADRELQRRQPQHRRDLSRAAGAHQVADRRAGPPRARAPDRGGADHLRHPHPPGPELQPRSGTRSRRSRGNCSSG